MPLVTAVVLAYAAGLLSGFGGAFLWTASGALVVVWVGGRTGRDRIGLAAVSVAGFTMATAARKSQSACLESMPAHRAWVVTLSNDASPGAFVGARHRCGVRFQLAV